jgi:HD-like signal output (HDOD) protein
MTVAFAISRDKIIASARTLPAAPQVMVGLCELLQDVNADLEQIAGQIQIDPALATRVIRISNGPAYGGRRIGSVDEAVNRVGFGEILRLVGAATVAGLVDQSLTCYRIEAPRLRESLLLHALASETLARWTDVDPRTAYAGGLLRALGMMVIDRLARGSLPADDAFDGAQFATYAEWEGARFGLSNPEVTTMILDEWRFPPELVAGIQAHLAPAEAGTDDRLAVVLNLAGAVCARSGLALPGDEKFWEPTPDKLAAAGLDEAQLVSAGEQALAVFAVQRDMLA